MKTEQIAAFTRRTHEIYRRLKEGTLPVEATLAGLQKLIESGFDSIVDLDADPVVPDGWSVESHAKGGKFDFAPGRIGLYLCEEQKNLLNIEGHKLRKKLKNRPIFNANLLDWLLRKENKRFIPEGWKGKDVFFWGTIYRSNGGELAVRRLCVRGGGWCSQGYHLDYGYGHSSPAAVALTGA